MNAGAEKPTTKQIVSNGYTSIPVWDDLEIRSRQTRQKVQLRCPNCSAELRQTQTGALRCGRFCQTSVEVFQRRHLTETSDRRRIYKSVNADETEILDLELRCLSCERPLMEEEACTNTCKVQTFLMLEEEEGELYVKRWVNALNVSRVHTEIPLRPLIPDATAAPANTITDPADPVSSKTANQRQAIDDPIPDRPSNRHKDVAGQILDYLSENGDIGKTPKMKEALDCSPQSFKEAIDKLIETRRIRKVVRGVYELIHRR